MVRPWGLLPQFSPFGTFARIMDADVSKGWPFLF